MCRPSLLKVTAIAILGLSPLLAGAQTAPFHVGRFPASDVPTSSSPGDGAAAPLDAADWQEVLWRLEQTERELESMRAALEHSGAPVQGPVYSIAGPVEAPHPPIYSEGNSPTAMESRVIALEQASGKAQGPEFPKVKLTGFFHADAGWYGQDATSLASVGDLQDGVGFRRARLQAVGSVAEFTNYSLEMDFGIAGRPSLMDVWLEQSHLPFFGTVRVGHFRQPCTMDSYTPIRDLTFLERSLPFQAFDPFRRVGIMAYDNAESQRTTWQYSIYRTGGFLNGPLGDTRFANDIGDTGGYSCATRLTHLLWYDEPAEGRYLLHVGGNVNYGRNTGNDYVAGTPFYEARAIPEFFLGDASAVPAPGAPPASVATPPFVDTGRILSRDFQVYGVELAAQYGPAHFQSEYVITTVDQIGGPALFFDGAYAQAGYFLTGENRKYNRSFGAFDRVVPFEDFFSLEHMGVCGWGAWELAGRLSYLNLNDPDVQPLPGFPSNPGRMTDGTLGLNWYWNAHTKFQFNWIHVWLDNAALGNSDTDIYSCRGQLEF
jgi:phosphate-selective porin OprO/OprP